MFCTLYLQTKYMQFIVCNLYFAAPGPAKTTVPEDRDLLPMDCNGFNPYHNPNDIKRFNIQRSDLLMDEVELGSGNFGCVKKGVFKTESWGAEHFKNRRWAVRACGVRTPCVYWCRCLCFVWIQGSDRRGRQGAEERQREAGEGGDDAGGRDHAPAE